MKTIVLDSRTMICRGSRWVVPVVCGREPQTDRDWSTEFKFWALAGLAVLGPAVGCCVTIRRLWPLYWMVCNLILGIALGWVMFRNGANAVLSCVPAICPPSMPLASSRNKLNRGTQFGPAQLRRVVC